MPKPRLHVCRCAVCRSRRPQPERRLHQQLNLLISRLDERQRRWFVALEAQRRGHGGTRQMAEITGLSERTIRRGRREWAAGQVAHAAARVRAPGAGRRASERRDSALLAVLAALLAPETAGDPQCLAKYKRSSLRTLSARLRAAGHPASPPTVARLLRQLGYSPKANVRRAEARTVPAERDAQFRHIAAQRAAFHAARAPVISVDTKKKS